MGALTHGMVMTTLRRLCFWSNIDANLRKFGSRVARCLKSANKAGLHAADGRFKRLWLKPRSASRTPSPHRFEGHVSPTPEPEAFNPLNPFDES